MGARLFFALALVNAVAGNILAQSDSLDLIPSKAAAAIVIRDADDLRKKGDDFLKETGLNLPLRPADALDFVKTFLGIKEGWTSNSRPPRFCCGPTTPRRPWASRT